MKKLWLKYIITITLTLATMSIVAFSYAAYLNRDKYVNPLDVNTVALSTYFSGGTGAETAPYLIANSDQLRNLQRLTLLGVFKNDSHFALLDSFTWDNTDGPLHPIGTLDNPFYGEFDGRGRTITNLIVDGANTSDVGMFGYVAMGGLIRNLVLSAPTIHINQNTTDAADKTKRTINPLDDYLFAYAQALDDIALTSTTSNSATFQVPALSVSVSIGGEIQDFDIVYETTDAARLYESSPGYWTTAQTAGAVATDLYPVQLSARVFALYDNKVISYTLERWQINVRGDGQVLELETNVFRTLHRIDDEHETYVGIFIGYLDGGASYLGLWGGNTDSTTANGKIVVNGRAARSFNVLIGRSRTDNPLDTTAANYYSRLVDISAAITNNSSIWNTTYAIPQTPLTDFATQESRAITASTAYGLTSTETNYIRFYPRIQHVLTNFDTQLDDGTITTGQPYSARTMRLNQPLGVGVRATYQNKWYGSGWYNRDFAVLNGFWLWSTDTISSQAEAVFGLNQFEISFKITYVATSTSLANNFQILFNQYNPDIFGQFLWFTWEENLVKNNTWSDLAGQTTVIDGATVPIYTPSQHPVVKQLTPTRTSSGVIQEMQVDFIINREDQGFWQDIYSYTFLSEPYYPMFGIGVGKTLTQTSNTSGSTYRYYYGNFNADSFSLDILSVDFLFTARQGNVSNLLNNVDFLYSLPTYTNNPDGTTTFSAWNKNSNVKIQFNVIDPALNLSGTTYRFWRVAGFSGVNSTVYGIYTTGTNYAPFNTINYANATLTAGAA